MGGLLHGQQLALHKQSNRPGFLRCMSFCKKDFHYHCQSCGYMSVAPTNVVRHEKMRHGIHRPGVKYLQCRVCSALMVYATEYAKHVLQHLTGDRGMTADLQEFVKTEVETCAHLGLLRNLANCEESFLEDDGLERVAGSTASPLKSEATAAKRQESLEERAAAASRSGSGEMPVTDSVQSSIRVFQRRKRCAATPEEQEMALAQLRAITEARMRQMTPTQVIQHLQEVNQAPVKSPIIVNKPTATITGSVRAATAASPR